MDALLTLAALVVVPLVVPFVLCRHIIATVRIARIRRSLSGSTRKRIPCGQRAATGPDGLIVRKSPLTKEEVIAWESVDSMELIHVRGDGGFADANTEHYLVVWTLKESSGSMSDAMWVSTGHPSTFATDFLQGLKRQGFDDSFRAIDGLERGLPLFLFFGVPGFALIAALAYWLGGPAAVAFVVIAPSLLFYVVRSAPRGSQSP